MRKAVAALGGLLPSHRALPEEEALKKFEIPTTISDLLLKVRKAREEHKTIEASIANAQADLRKLEDERGQVQARLTEWETNIAISSQPFPEEPLPEEAEIATVRRKERIAAARVRLLEDTARKSQAKITELVGQLRADWRRFGIEEARNIRATYHETAVGLRNLFIEHVIWSRHFGNVGVTVDFPNMALYVVAEAGKTDPEYTTFDSRLMNTESLWTPDQTKLADQIKSFGADIDAAENSEV